MEAMMKQFGADTSMSKAEEAALLKEFNIGGAGGPESEEDKILRQIMAGGDGSDEEMDEEALLAALDAEENQKENQAKLEEAENLKEKADEIMVKTRKLYSEGKKPEACESMKIYKNLMKKYNDILEGYPDVKEALQPQPKAEEKKVATAPAATQKCTLNLEEIYEQYHNCEDTNSMSIIEKEIARCTKVKASTKDEELQDIMELRIDQLQSNKEATEGDI